MSELKSKSGASGPLQSIAQECIAAPCPIRFTRAITGDLAQAERREWWIANGLGGYASGTIAGSLTRRYHGLLIAPVASPLGRRLILAKADATLIEGSRSWPLFTNRWRSGDIAPVGHVRIGSFHLDYSAPVWTYEIGDRHVEAHGGYSRRDFRRRSASPSPRRPGAGLVCRLHFGRVASAQAGGAD